MASIFLSHSHKDKGFVKRLAEDLRRSGVRVWEDDAEIMIGDSLIARIEQAISEMDYLGVVLSKSSVTSKWVREELELALNHQIASSTVKVLPLLIEDCNVPAILQGKLFADFRDPDGYRRARTALLARLGIATRERLEIEPEVALIPAGTFLMGSDPRTDLIADPDEQPQHSVFLPDYWLGKHPVTIGQYAAFARSTNRETRHRMNLPEPTRAGDNLADLPVTFVTWYDALLYCEWLKNQTGRKYCLPSEAEWEKGARGTDGRIYPWGSIWESSHCRNADTHAHDRYDHRNANEAETSVYSYPVGTSPYHLYHMAGNVQEWTRNLWGSGASAEFGYPYDAADGREDPSAPETVLRVVRGGSFRDRPKAVRSAYRNAMLPGDRGSIYVGFRVAVHP